MKVTILEVKSKKEVDAFIDSYKGRLLPDIHDGWRFNFRKHVKTSGANAYILYAEITPGKIEGCLIFKMREKLEPYMAHIWHTLKLPLAIEARIQYMKKLQVA